MATSKEKGPAAAASLRVGPTPIVKDLPGFPSSRIVRKDAHGLEQLQTSTDSAAQVRIMVELAMVMFLVWAAFFSCKRRGKDLPQEEAKFPERTVSFPELATEAKACETDEPPTKHIQAELKEPPAMRRLQHIGASYAIPRTLIGSCCQSSLSFDIPTLPCVWPLRAQLSRPGKSGGWTKLELTVDIFDASDLPPLLTCTRTSDLPIGPEETGGTGGQYVYATNKVASKDAAESGVPWLSICNAEGNVVATILRQPGGSCTVERQGRANWSVDVHLEEGIPRIFVSSQHKELGQATLLGRGKQEHLQMDTQQDAQTPESCTMLMTMLAMLVFGP